MESNNYTFWQLMNECSVEIPTIQRDYTYGRKNAREISKNLIKAILKALSPQSPKLHLDFVYGKRFGMENIKELERNKLSIESLLSSVSNYAENLNLKITYNTTDKNTEQAEIVTLIPLDGQQRLTTLFLVHWYFVNHLKKSEDKRILNRFSYATRVSSREFLKMLCDSNTLFEYDSNVKLSDNIKNHEDFYASWEKDPTVRSMLVVLDVIEKQFVKSNIDAVTCWESLINDSKITFDFFDLDDYELTDELYLKMNARGKQLTNFENFKAWLIESNNKHVIKPISVDKWEQKFDIDWNDIFWNEKSIEQTQIDSAYLQFFKNMFLGDYLLKENSDEKSETIDLLRNDVDYNPISAFKMHDIFMSRASDYLQVLDFFAKKNLIEPELHPSYFDKETTSIRKLLFHKNHELTWWHSTIYFAITRYILKNHDSNVPYFNQWFRVISNLIYNTPIESPRMYREACKSILNLIDNVKNEDVYQTFSSMDVSVISFFSEKQKEEEILKANFIVKNPSEKWEEAFIKLECHSYFYGQIGFIFKLPKTRSFDEFNSISEKVSILFSEEIMVETNNLLFRSFLTIEVCFLVNGNALTYPSNARVTLRNRNENWRRFIDVHFETLVSFLEKNSFEQNNIKHKLNELIANYSDNGTAFSKYIKNEKLLEYPLKNHIRQNENAYYLLSKTRIYSYYVETYTYDWYTSNLELCKAKSIIYKQVKGENSIPGLFVQGKEDITLYFNKSNNRFAIQNGIEIEFDNIEEAIKALIQ